MSQHSTSSPKRTPTVPATLSVDRGKGTAAGALRTSSISCPLFQTRLPAPAFPGRGRFHTQPQQQISQWASTAPPARSARRPCQLHWVWIGEKGLPRAPSARAASPARFLFMVLPSAPAAGSAAAQPVNSCFTANSAWGTQVQSIPSNKAVRSLPGFTSLGSR